MKFIYSIGPKSIKTKIISELAKNAYAFRINTAHLNINEFKKYLNFISNVFLKNRIEIPVYIDLQGVKIRTAALPKPFLLKDKVDFVFGEVTGKNHIPVDNRLFFSSLSDGDIFTIDDGKLIFEVLKNKNFSISTKVLQGGFIHSKKGINIKNKALKLEAINSFDFLYIKEALKYSFTNFAISFIYDGSEAEIYKVYTNNRTLVAKIEREVNFSFLNKIENNFDKLWFCRGDFTEDICFNKLGYYQNLILKSINKELFLAGQVLEHMTKNILPTRSEIAHLYDVCQNGYKGIVLSDETAIGKYPLLVNNFLINFFKDI